MFFPRVKENMREAILRPAELIDLSNQPGHVSIVYEPFKPEKEITKKEEGKKTFMHLGLYTTDNNPVNEYPNKLFHFSFPFFPSFYIFFFSFHFFFLSSLIPSRNFIFVFHSAPLSFALGVELCFSFFSDQLLSSQGAVTTSHKGKTKKKKQKQEKKIIRKAKSNEGITLRINENEK